ncbi:MAG: hypothetical protein GEEBNDBF_01281 [bacterium]|nr:hypothetical protein [bacterium]
MSRLWLALFCSTLLLVPSLAVAQGGDDDDETGEDPILADDQEGDDDPSAMSDEDADEYYNDGISTSWDDGEPFGDIAEDTFIWSYRGGDSFLAWAIDVINDDLPPDVSLHDWDITGGSDEADEPPMTSADIQAKLEDESFSPLKQVLADGPLEGQEVPLMVLVPDSVLAEARTTQSLPNVAILKAVTVADQLTNGLKFTYVKRQDLITFQPGPQSGVPQLQFRDAKVYEGVVQFHFDLGMPYSTYGAKRRGSGYTARADVPSSSIADGFDRAREEALRMAVRRAIGEAARGRNTPMPEQVTGSIDFWEITNEGYQEGTFTVELTAWVTVEALGAPAPMPTTTAPRAGEPIIIDGSDDDSGY